MIEGGSKVLEVIAYQALELTPYGVPCGSNRETSVGTPREIVLELNDGGGDSRPFLTLSHNPPRHESLRRFALTTSPQIEEKSEGIRPKYSTACTRYLKSERKEEGNTTKQTNSMHKGFKDDAPVGSCDCCGCRTGDTGLLPKNRLDDGLENPDAGGVSSRHPSSPRVGWN